MREFDFTTVPIVDIVNEIIVDGATNNASDIHFDPAEKYLKIRMRIDGDLRDYSIIENKYKRNLTTRIKLLSGMNITESRLPQDGAIKTNINGKDLDLRVAVLPTSFGEKVVIRILDYTRSFEGIEALGFTKENYKRIENMLNNPNGIILVTGATGSGKSTTVYSMLQRLNKEDTNIITVEDPVEMNIEGINQVQVNSEIGLDFAAVLRSILREDPNVILIGEIRDSETAKIAVRASITGHLVLSTLHTNNSLTTIERLLDMDVERYLLSTSLKGIISQTLAKRMCQKCKKQRATTAAEKRIFKKVLGQDVNFIYEPGGCPNCRNGYKGRIALQEVLYLNDEIRDAINENINRADLRDMIYKKGTKTLFQDGLLKVIDGTTTLEEVFKLVDVDDDFDNVYGKDDETNINEEQEENVEEENDDLNENSDENNDVEQNEDADNNGDDTEEHKNDWFNTPNLTELLNQVSNESDENSNEEEQDDLINTTDLTDLLNQISGNSDSQNDNITIDENDVIDNSNNEVDYPNDDVQNELINQSGLNDILNQEASNYDNIERYNIITNNDENDEFNFDGSNNEIDYPNDDVQNELINQSGLNDILNQETSNDDNIERYNIITNNDENDEFNFDGSNNEIDYPNDDDEQNELINQSGLNDILNQETSNYDNIERYNIITNNDENDEFNFDGSNNEIDYPNDDVQNELINQSGLNDILNQETSNDDNIERYNIITNNDESDRFNFNGSNNEVDISDNKKNIEINFNNFENDEHKNDWFNTPNLTELLNQTSNDNLDEKEIIKYTDNDIKKTTNKKNEENNSSNYTDDLINIINQGFFE